MAADLVRRHRTAGLRLPPGFWLWGLFLVWSVAGLAFTGLTPPGTLPESGGPAGAMMRVLTYLSLTVLLLYIGNTPGRPDPTRPATKTRRALGDLDVGRVLAVLCVATIGGGFLGLVAPQFEFTSPVEMLLPAGVAADPYVQALVHPASAQIMDVLGYESARPKAPWEYTNTWGNMLSLLLIWLAVAWIARGGAATRCAAVAAVAAAAVPVVYSLNRALWVGLALSVVFLLVCLARRGRVAAVALCSAGLAVIAIAALMSPLAAVVQERADHPHSDDGRAAASIAAVEAANASPVVGWGTTRDMLGSSASIAVGSTPECPGCGNHTIGNNGQLQLLLIANGWVGTALFVAFFAQIAWRFRRDTSPVGAACLLILLLLFWYMSFYVALAGPLAVSMVAVALLWRRAAEGRSPAVTAGGGAP
ncbi:ligase [Nocardiopsis sediminis]|uniref:Ligase n=1 Tax=Nocardiopsis sediminis TaxID=1778267 RepID=A0ABV8FFE0_9ACTN